MKQGDKAGCENLDAVADMGDRRGVSKGVLDGERFRHVAIVDDGVIVSGGTKCENFLSMRGISRKYGFKLRTA